eukprot:403377431
MHIGRAYYKATATESMWNTPRFTGNSGRYPFTPFEGIPYPMDIPEYQKYTNKKILIEYDARYNYRQMWLTNFMHPQRERNDSIIFDAEFTRDIMKRLEEQRHQLALQCVALGIFDDVYQAKQTQRDLKIKNSDYKYKHLLYRN